MKHKSLIIISISIISIFSLAYVLVPKYYESYVLKNEMLKESYDYVDVGQVISINKESEKSTKIKSKIMERKEDFDLDIKDYNRKFYTANYIPDNYIFETAVNTYYLSPINFDISETPLQVIKEDSGISKIFKQVENYQNYSKTYVVVSTLFDKNPENSLANPKIYFTNSLTYEKNDTPVINTILSDSDINSPSYKEITSDVFSKAYYVERPDGMQMFVGINPLEETIKYYDFDGADLERIIIKEEYEKEYNSRFVVLSATDLNKEEFNKIIEGIKEM